MTVEELRVEAKKLGYNLIKLQEPFGKLMKCSCGRTPGVKRAFRIGKSGYVQVVCPNCKQRGPLIGDFPRHTYSQHEMEKLARDAWNEGKRDLQNDITDIINNHRPY